ncbi:AraC family transcriptional regulator [Myxococcaceae bacterium GXIMD 01537]
MAKGHTEPAFTGGEGDGGARSIRVVRFGGDPAARSDPRLFAHPYAVIVLVTEGASQARHRGPLRLEAGDVHLIPPGDAHGGLRGLGVRGFAVSFGLEALPSRDFPSPGGALGHPLLAPLKRVRGGCHPVFRVPPRTRARLERLMSELEAEQERSEHWGAEWAMRALLELILVEVGRVAEALPQPPAAPGVVAEALAFIEAHALSPLSLADVARAVNKSPGHLTTLLREQTGRTVGGWIASHRMAEARRRLVETDEAVAIIGERVGYSDVTHFIRTFRRAFGQTPLAFRREAQRAAGAPPPRPSRGRARKR